MERGRKSAGNRLAANLLAGHVAGDGVHKQELAGQRQQIRDGEQIPLEPAQENPIIVSPGRLQAADYFKSRSIVTGKIVSDSDDCDGAA
jgi:hypothetical protein